MTIFDYLKDIVVTKKGDLPLDSYLPYLVSRWLSFINPEVCLLINQANTKTLLEDKSQHYKLMLSLFPRLKFVPKINYIKKVKETVEEDQRVNVLAENLEISKREATFLLSPF